jgi:hypothetical protein
MDSIDFSELSREQADEWCRFVARRGPAALAELATWMAADGGPVDEADGTWVSLQPVWSWAVDFARRGAANSLGIPLRLSSPSRAFGLLSSPGVPSAALGEDLHYYVFEVLKGADADTHWSVFASTSHQRVVDGDHFTTGISYDTGWVSLGSNLPTMIRQAVRGHSVGDSAGLQTHLLRELAMDVAPSSDRGPSLLRPRVSTTPWAPPVPDFSSVIRKGADVERFGVASGVLSKGATIEDLSAGRGLEPQALLDFLEPFGLAVADGVAERAKGLTETGLRGTLYSTGVLVESFGTPARLSSLVLDPTVISEAEWKTLSAAAEVFAHEQGALFIPLEQ